MLVSRSYGNQNYRPIEVESIDDLAELILKNGNYSLSTFKNKDRTIKSFERAEVLGLDFDDGLSLEDALDAFADYKHIIATTKSHQIEKNGVVADRFRVILFLEEPITNSKDFSSTMLKLHDEYPQADPACKDPSRMFYQSTNVIQINREGKVRPIVRWVEPPPTPEVELQQGERGTLLKATLEFLQFGAKAGTANDALYRAAKDMQQNGYSKDEVTGMVAKMIDAGGTWGTTSLNPKDLQTIDSAFSTESKDQPRVEENPFNFMSIGDLLKVKNNVTWTVDGLFMDGGMSIIVGPPKSGKSTLVRQLAKAVCRGENFLGRKVKKGGVAYLALEEHPGALKEQFKKVGVTKNDPIMIHVGHLNCTAVLAPLTAYVHENRPALIVIDTLSLFGNFESINDYEQVNSIMHGIKKIARETGVHLVLVHHTRKSEVMNTNAVLGSQAIFGSVDAALFFNAVGSKRYVSTSGRMTKNFTSMEILFNEKTETYIAGKESGGEF